MATTERSIGAILVALVVGVIGFQAWVSKSDRERARSVERRADAAQRFERWAYVDKANEVAPGEIIKLVVIPHSSGVDFLDTKCLIYTHQEFRTSSMICPDASRDDIEAKE